MLLERVKNTTFWPVLARGLPVADHWPTPSLCRAKIFFPDPQRPLFHQSSSSAGSEPEPSFKPVLCFLTPKAPAPNQEKRFVRSTKTLLG